MIERTLRSLAIERSLEGGYSSVITWASHPDYVDCIKLIKLLGLRTWAEMSALDGSCSVTDLAEADLIGIESKRRAPVAGALE